MAKVDLGQVVGDDGKDALIDETVTGDIVTFSDGYVGMPLKSLVAEITPIQEGTGGPSPTNIRPISGRTGLTVTVQSGETQNEYPITWESIAGTVYGGTLDVVSGVLTVDRAIITLDGSQSVAMSSSNRAYVSVANAVAVVTSNQLTEASVICDRLKPTSWGNLALSRYNLYCAPLYGRGVAFRDDTKTTAADWKAYFTENPTQFSYKLATPQTYQLTPTEVRTILGENLVYSDAGDVTVNYYADTKGYIDKRLNTTRMMIAGVETSFVATKNYAIGDFVIVNDTLYRITAVITSGETITPGTNATETTVAEQLIALYNA